MAIKLAELSEALAATVEQAGKSVVRVEGRRRLGATGAAWSDDGLVVTANHVVRQDEGVRIGLADGSEAPAVLVGRDPTTDLALLRVNDQRLLPPTWQNIGSIGVGHLVLALGRPGKTVQATLGIVSALGKEWQTMVGSTVDAYVQTDVVMYPGFSGGPLVSASGGFIGLNTSALGRGISLTLPAATLERVVGALKAHGRIPRGYLGVAAQPVTLPAALAQQLGQETGLLVVSVEDGSPADKAGLLLGDILATLDGKALSGMDNLLSTLSGLVTGTSVAVRLVRGGSLMDLQVTVGER